MGFQIGFLESHHWTWANHIANWGSLAVWFIYQAVYSTVCFLFHSSLSVCRCSFFFFFFFFSCLFFSFLLLSSFGKQLQDIGWENYGIFTELWRNSKYLLLVTLTVVVSLVPDLVIKFYKFNYQPDLYQAFQQLEQHHEGKWLRSSSGSSSVMMMEAREKAVLSGEKDLATV